MFFEEVIEVGDFDEPRSSYFSVKKNFPPARFFCAEIRSCNFDYYTIGSFKPLLLLKYFEEGK